MPSSLYTLRKRAVMLHAHGKRQAVYFLRLAARNVLAQDSQTMVDQALRHAAEEWPGCRSLPELVVQVGIDGIPRTGSPIYRWQFLGRPFCFEHELPSPSGYLGERELWGYLFRTVEEHKQMRDLETAELIDRGAAKVYRDFWKGDVFESGEEFLTYRRQFRCSRPGMEAPPGTGRSPLPSKVSKILSLIGHIERKGDRASRADLHYLKCLKDKALQLGHVA